MVGISTQCASGSRTRHQCTGYHKAHRTGPERRHGSYVFRARHGVRNNRPESWDHGEQNPGSDLAMTPGRIDHPAYPASSSVVTGRAAGLLSAGWNLCLSRFRAPYGDSAGACQPWARLIYSVVTRRTNLPAVASRSCNPLKGSYSVVKHHPRCSHRGGSCTRTLPSLSLVWLARPTPQSRC